LEEVVAAQKKEDLIQVKADKTDESLLLKNCGLSNETLRAMEKRGITSLFPIQKHVFDPAMGGRDLIGRAKTGSGKTLAFAIPVVESLLKENKVKGRMMRGRAPRAIVITPTRELANQVCREFQSVCPSLSVKSFYGGVSVRGNKDDLYNGVDVAVGTPGRLMDLVNQGALDLSTIRFAILDESDQMLDMGFEEDMEKILAYTPQKKQTMLFSATLPAWVRKIARKYLTDHIIVDLLGDEGTGKISDTITALGIVVQHNAKRKMLGDLLSTYAAGKQSIVFTQTKREADLIRGIADNAVPSAALHGDITQSSRERTLQDFRHKRFSCLVATDVAARGLDIPSVDLVLHYDCPQTHESFVHRSGRTGRAGNTGTTLVMVTKDELHVFNKIVRDSKTAIEMIGPPHPRDVMQASTKHVLDKIKDVQPEVLKFFEPAATKLVAAGNGTQVLAAALASMSGFVKVPRPRSLLTQNEGMVTLRFLARPGRITTIETILTILTDLLDQPGIDRHLGQHENVRDDATQMTGLMVDVPSSMAMQVLESASNKSPKLKGVRVDRPKALTLEQLMAQNPPQRGNSSNGRGRSNRGGFNSGRGGFRGNRSRSEGRFRSDDREFGRFDRRDRFDDGPKRFGKDFSGNRGNRRSNSFDSYRGRGNRRSYSTFDRSGGRW